MVAPSPDLIERLQQAAEEGRQTIRELHEARRDARQAQVELEALVQRVKDEVIEGCNDLIRQHMREAMDTIDVKSLGAGLKETFHKWVILLREGTDVLERLNERDAEFARLIGKLRGKYFIN